MKITPLAQGTGVPAQSDSSLGKTADASKLARAKAIASGQQVDKVEPSGDPQVDRARASIKKIKMKTQFSTNRHEAPPAEEPDPTEPVVESLIADGTIQSPTPDTNEQTQGTEETRPLSPQFAALAKTKRALQVKERELAQREEALKAQSPVNSADYISKADLIANPLKIFEAGLTYDQLTEAILNNPTANAIDPIKLRAEIKEDIKKELLGEFSTRDQQAEAQVLADIKREAMAITAQGDDFEAIREARAQQTVVDLIHRTWKTTGEVMDVMDAAQLVENQLIDEAIPFARIKKVQSRLTPAQEQQIAQTPIAPKPNTKIMRTLTNRDNASPVMDRRARAIAAMNGTLKRG